MMNITIPVDAVAWYAAIVATASAFVVGYAIWRDRTKLRVTVMPSMKIFPTPDGHEQDATFAVIKAANTGRRPIHLGDAHLMPREKGNKAAMLTAPWLPGPQLDEGQSASTYVDLADLDLRDFGFAVVYDGTGKGWKARIPKEDE